MKSPKKLRSDIRILANHIVQLRDGLMLRGNEPLADIGKECVRTADALSAILKSTDVPADYKVAVVGRFKAGKSSFVNELLEARLAGEDTSPETAAVTTFRHGDRVKATVRFIARETWVSLQRLHHEDPNHVDAHRVRMWKSFAGKGRKAQDGEVAEPFDLPSLESMYVKSGGHALELEMAPDGTKKAEAEFRRRLKEFTTGSRPHHCLVETIEIHSPAEVLDQGVLLIDTPGLDDTERFRVSLTEQAVADVDAVLFLTKSGAAYGQSEKDFLLTLLRQGTVKQLIVVVTQVDQTYDQYVSACESDDEEPDSLALRIEKERVRIALEIAKTLDELQSDDSPAMRRYREQLGDVVLAFTSARLHRDWKAGKTVPFSIAVDDPGGVEKLKRDLMYILSTESRLALTARAMSDAAKDALLDLKAVLANKLVAIRDIKDREVAEKKLGTFRREFGAAGERFKADVENCVELLRQRLNDQRAKQLLHIQNVALLAEKELDAYQLYDIGRHWRTRRSGYWGYMSGLQKRVANRIFPKVQEVLSEQSEAFAGFTRDFEVYLARLSSEGAAISAQLELGATMPFDVTGKLTDSLERSLSSASELIEKEELQVTALLDDFVSDEVSDRIDACRKRVSDIFGRGTTTAQSSEVQDFYREVKELLGTALTDHLSERFDAFGGYLTVEAEAAPRDALNEVHTLLEQAADNIRAAAQAAVAGQKEATESLARAVQGQLEPVVAECEALATATESGDDSPVRVVQPQAVAASGAPAGTPSANGGSLAKSASSPCAQVAQDIQASSADAPAVDEDEAWFEQVRRTATAVIRRHHLKDGETGWPLERVFEAELLRGANQVMLIDPYLSAHHQLRNLQELLLLVAETVRPRELRIVTAPSDIDSAERQQRVLDEAARDLFKNYGVALEVERAPSLHDRYLILDHGVLFKLGRGLDIYKPATGLAAHRPANRRVRQTEVDVFVTSAHPLSAKA